MLLKDNFEKIDTKIVFATIIELVDDKIEKKDIEEIKEDEAPF